MRRLPPWMVGGASTGETAARKCSEPEAPKKKPEKRPRRSQNPKEKEEPKRVVRRKIREEVKRSNGPEMIQSVVSGQEDENLTVDDLLSFAHEYVRSDEDQTRKDERESLSKSKSMLVLDESSSSSSQGGNIDPTTQDMLHLLLGPFSRKLKP